jgi:hypothetical protein
MKVMAQPGMTCPTEHNAKMRITDKPVDVPDTIYYRRLISEGSLLIAPDTIQEPSAGAPKEKGRK